MSVSARNQLTGKVTAIASGAVNDEVEVTLTNGEKLTAVVTARSQKTLGLEPGKEVVALIKASWVMLASADCDLLFSARNQFEGEIVHLEKGAVNSSVKIKTASGMQLTAVVTNESLEEMTLQTGKRIFALVKASSVLLAVKAH